MTRHTESPWEIKLPDHEGAIPTAVQAITWHGRVTICTFPWTLRRQAGAIPFNSNQTILETWYANANLVSAAPDLLRACVSAMYYIAADVSVEYSEGEPGSASKVAEELQRAVAKAEGR